MKKNVFVILISAVLLSGCSFDFVNFNGKNSEKTQEIPGISDNSNNKEESKNDVNSNKENQEDNTNEKHDNDENLEQEYTETIEMHGDTFQSLFTEGFNFEIGNAPSEFKEYLDSFLEYENLISSLSCVKCTSRKIDSDTFFQIGTGSPAKGKFNEGIFTWNSIVKIYKVEVTAFNYSNPYTDYATGNLVPNVDTNGHIWIDEDDNSLEISSNDSPKTDTFSKEYASGTTSFSLKATAGRILIKNLKITWRG